MPKRSAGLASQAGCEPNKRRRDLPCGTQARDDIARDLRHAALAAAMIDRNLADAQALRGGAHLHFEVPAVSKLAHAEIAERGRAYRAEWRHVGIADAVDEAQQQSGKPPGDPLLRRHAAGFAPAAQARPHYEIGFAARNRTRDVSQKIRHVAAVPVEEADDIGIGADRSDAGGASPTV